MRYVRATAIGAVIVLLSGVPARAANLAASSGGGTVAVTVNAAKRGPSINHDLLGVDGPGPAGAVPAMQALGIRWVRTDVSFEGTFDGRPVYDCRTGAWDPTLLDQRVERVRAEGALPLLIVDYTPACLATAPVPGYNPNYAPPDIGVQQARWDALVATMAAHEINAEDVRAFEIWNEPDGFFWTGSLAAYLNLYADTSRILAAAADRLKTKIEIGGPGLLFADASWIEPFLAAVEAQHLPLDFLSWHWYADYPMFGPMSALPLPQPKGVEPYWYNPALRAQSFGLQVELVQAEVAKYRGLHPRLWLDEWNADAGYDPRQDGPFDGALVAAALDSVQRAGLDRMCFFFVADEAGNPLGNWGLLDTSLRPKPSYIATQFWHELTGFSVETTVSPDQSATDPTGRIGGVAAIDATGRVRVLLYNFVPYDPTGRYGQAGPTSYDHRVVLRVPGLSNRSQWSERLVDATHRGEVVAGGRLGGVVTLVLSGESVALLTIG